MRTLQAVSDLTDAELMRRVQADDPIAFEELFERFGARARRVASMTYFGSASSDDVLQEAFLGIWRSRASYRADRGSVSAGVLGVVRLRAIDAWRRDARHDSRRERLEGAAEALPDALDIEAVTGERDHAATLRAALVRLPEAQRGVIVPAYFGELNATEIASELSIPLGTVKGRMRLGLDKLRAAPEQEDARPCAA